jgi:hypothetical protein
MKKVALITWICNIHEMFQEKLTELTIFEGDLVLLAVVR